MKQCTKCKSHKATDHFYKNKASPDGCFCWCRLCCRERYQEDNKDRIEAKNKRMATNRERAMAAKNERIEAKKLKAEAAKERAKLRASTRYQENKDHILAINKKWSQANKHKRNARARQRRKEDPLFRLSLAIRARITKALKNETKDTSSIDLLGCSVEYARQRLESQFTKGMTWKNHGVKGWHIDHIIPCDSFDLSDMDQKKQCFHYTNLQPLWWRDNIIKANKLPDQYQPQLPIHTP